MVDAKSLASLSELASAFNSASDNLNKSIQKLNKQLAAMNIGLEFYLGDPSFDDGDDRPLIASGKLYNNDTSPPSTYEVKKYLGWDKLGDEWQLAIKTVTVDHLWNDETREVEPVSDLTYKTLLRSSRETRLKAVDSIDDLIRGLESYVLENLQRVEKMAELAKPK